jgi:hypothetical protein
MVALVGLYFSMQYMEFLACHTLHHSTCRGTHNSSDDTRVGGDCDSTRYVKHLSAKGALKEEQRRVRFYRNVVNLIALYQCGMVCCACIAAAVLRHHLMVWAIFAPKVTIRLPSSRFVYMSIREFILKKN